MLSLISVAAISSGYRGAATLWRWRTRYEGQLWVLCRLVENGHCSDAEFNHQFIRQYICCVTRLLDKTVHINVLSAWNERFQSSSSNGPSPSPPFILAVLDKEFVYVGHCPYDIQLCSLCITFPCWLSASKLPSLAPASFKSWLSFISLLGSN